MHAAEDPVRLFVREPEMSQQPGAVALASMPGHRTRRHPPVIHQGIVEIIVSLRDITPEPAGDACQIHPPVPAWRRRRAEFQNQILHIVIQFVEESPQAVPIDLSPEITLLKVAMGLHGRSQLLEAAFEPLVEKTYFVASCFSILFTSYSGKRSIIR